MRLTRYFALKAVAVLALTMVAFAQDAPPPADDQGPDPDAVNRGVARISIMSGDVSVRRGDSGDYVAAALNAPLVVGDRIITGPNSRAEVQFDWANMIRMGSDAEIRLAELADRRYMIQVARGLVTYRVLRPSDADVEVSTPQASVRPKKEGAYRITVHDTTEVTVRAGEVEVFTPRGVETLRPGRTMQIRGTASDPEFQLVAAYGPDDWDRWNDNRDRDLLRSQSYQYMSRDEYGAEDLDQYGQWVQDPSYGEVWAPRVAPGWAPYREGHWVWIDYYGWSWVSYDPWGWAPYHYGRWYVHPTYGWCWYPGRAYGVRHYWSPGLVAFVGFGGGFGSVGWVPLAPYEPYHRWYGRGFYGANRGFGNVNVVNVNVYNTYRNARVNNAVTSIDSSGFARGGVGRAWHGSANDFQHASLVRGALPIAPQHESLRLGNRDLRPSTMPRSVDTQRFVSRRTPQQVERVPFEQQRRNFEQRPVSGFNQTAQPLAPRQENSNNNGWRRFGDPTPRAQQPSTTDSNAQRGWGRFGNPGASVDRGVRRSEPPRSFPQQAPTPQPQQAPPQQRNDNFRRFERPPQQQQPAQNAAPPAPRYDRNNFSRQEQRAPESVRISPPVVRERPQPQPRMEQQRPSGGNGGGDHRGGGGGGGRSDHGGGGRNR